MPVLLAWQSPDNVRKTAGPTKGADLAQPVVPGCVLPLKRGLADTAADSLADPDGDGSGLLDPSGSVPPPGDAVGSDFAGTS
jgi:hypothetical protein